MAILKMRFGEFGKMALSFGLPSLSPRYTMKWGIILATVRYILYKREISMRDTANSSHLLLECIQVVHDLSERRKWEEKAKILEEGIESLQDYAISLLDSKGNVIR